MMSKALMHLVYWTHPRTLDHVIDAHAFVAVHYSLGGVESALMHLGSTAAPAERLPSSGPGDPIRNIGVGVRARPLIKRKAGSVYPSHLRLALGTCRSLTSRLRKRS
jgi:hypothetical protein